MSKRKIKMKLLIPTLILAAFAVVALAVAYYQGEGRLVEGLRRSMNLTIMVIPLIFFALLLAGMIQVIVPKQFIADWLGNQSGFKGIMMGSLLGALTPGGPSVTLPLAAGFLGAGAGIGTMVSFLTAWSIMNITRMPFEAGILGWKFTLIHIASSFFLPPLAGYAAHIMFKGVKLDFFL
ncbi:MAG: permease [Deltaproteobacteria bacterium]|uniref:Permease n=1 Tax=Candidatus Zymogenus saltonus TaxID=2844893 RepID=A0A9D8KA76_9DELT|nr:permease [Candidatus Zymogenus saltonus]